MYAERFPFGMSCGSDSLSDLGPYCRALRCFVVDQRTIPNGFQGEVVVGRSRGIAYADRLAFDRIGLKQTATTPAIEEGRQLPTQIIDISHPGVHSKAPSWRHGMAGVSSDQHAAFAEVRCG